MLSKWAEISYYGDMDLMDMQSFTSFDEADEVERKERWAMSPQERLEILETLRSYMYEEAEPELQKVCEFVKLPRS